MKSQTLAKSKRPASYEDILNLPDDMTGEIIDGELYTSPRPSPKHCVAEGGLTEELRGPFQTGKRGGPGDWWILPEPELHLGPRTRCEVLVPDLAGWRKRRLLRIPDEPFITLIPDWVCEILSPGNAHLDRVKKVPAYAAFEVPYLWLLDPLGRTLEVYQLKKKKWLLLGSFGGNDKIRAEPFHEVEINLSVVWGE